MIRAPHFVKPIKEVRRQMPLIEGIFYSAKELNKVLCRAALSGPERASDSAQRVFGVLHQGACLPLKIVPNKLQGMLPL